MSDPAETSPTSPTATAGGGDFRFQPDEILVALSHEVRVIAALTDLGATVTVADRSVPLGLARLVVRPASSGTTNDATVDDLLPDLYAYFAERYEKWVPTVGKNRLVGRVMGSGELSFGGDGMPSPTPPAAGWPWSRGGRGRGARVAVIDTAVATGGPLDAQWLDRHSDLAAPVADTPVVPASGHASFVAGLILSQAPGAAVEVRQVLDGQGQATAWQVATAIVEAGRAGADVINLSLVCHTADGLAPLAMAQAIARLDPEVVVVAAAGNHGAHLDPHVRRRPAWPAALPDVIAVGAADSDGVIADFTPHDVPWIDLLADGVDLVSTYVRGDVTLTDAERSWSEWFDGFAAWSGTSFAAALVTGAIAAGIEPGRVSARSSLAELVHRAGRPSDGPPYVPLHNG